MERKIHFREKWLIILGIRGEAELIFKDFGSKVKYLQGVEKFYFRDLGRPRHKGAQTPLGAPDLLPEGANSFL